MTSGGNAAMQFCKDYILAAASNTYVARAVGMIGLSLTSMAISETFVIVKGYLWRNYVTELEVSSSDKCYHWLLQWIARHNDQLLHFTVNTVYKNTESGHATSKFDYEPCAGEHVFKYKGHSITVKRDRSQMMTNEYGMKPFETLHLSVWGRKRHLLNEILEDGTYKNGTKLMETDFDRHPMRLATISVRDRKCSVIGHGFQIIARIHAMTVMESGTTLMVPAYDTWQSFGEPRVPRLVSSVILDEGVFENILKDIQNFVDDHSWYLDRGIPYRRGYLLFGPPGCGKTSLIMALAGEIKYSVCVLSLNDVKMSDDVLIQLMGEVPSKSLVLLEDVDAMFANRQGTTVIEGSKKVTLSGLLNALDGVISSEGRILFMTTNHIDKLDPALIRSGRVDIKQHIGPCSDHQLSRMFKRFRPDSTDEDNTRFVSKIREQNKPVVPANLQEFFLVYRHKELHVLFEHINNIWQDL